MSTEENASHLYQEAVKLHNHSENIKRAHFIAAQRTRNYHRLTGLFIIVLNVLIGSTILKSFMPDKSDIIIGIFSALAAMLAGIQTFMNFQKETDAHLRAGDAYGRINRELELLIAEYKDADENHDDILNRFKSVHNKYLKANEDNQIFIPTDKDLKKAKRDLKREKGALITA